MRVSNNGLEHFLFANWTPFSKIALLVSVTILVIVITGNWDEFVGLLAR